MGNRSPERPTISVVVPFFASSHNQIVRCIESIVAQSVSPLEVIVVDDGNEGHMDELAEIDGMAGLVRVLRIQHGGVSAARNAGTAEAVGDYVCYVDSDDAIPLGTLERAREVLGKTKADYAMGYVRFSSEDSREEVVVTTEHPTYHWISPRDLIEYHYKGKPRKMLRRLTPIDGLKVAPFSRFVKREIAQGVLFDESVEISEDTLWNIQVLDRCDNAVLVEDVWYEYIVQRQSLSKGYHPDVPQKIVRTLSSVLRVSESLCTPPERPWVTERLLGEVGRVVRVCYAKSECKLSMRERRQRLNDLTRVEGVDDYLNLLSCLACGPVAVGKLALIRTGLIVPYWKIRQAISHSN